MFEIEYAFKKRSDEISNYIEKNHKTFNDSLIYLHIKIIYYNYIHNKNVEDSRWFDKLLIFY